MESKTSLESAQGFSVALGEACGICRGLCKFWRGCHCSWERFSYPSAYSFLEDNLMLLYLCLLSGTRASSSCLGDHITYGSVKSTPLLSALASFSCCGFRSFFSPEQLLLCEREEAGQSRHKSFSCCGERTNMSGWGEVIQEISGRGCGRLES